MNIAAILAFCAAATTFVVAISALGRRPWKIAQWAFFAGMLGFAAESVFVGLLALATANPERLVLWNKARMLCLAALPAPWLIFTATYSRGDYERILKKWLITILIFEA